mmetsp:Transcript_20695/g.57198  ORF Transcript_20695/g.57198 Transcript_20695/m.57198 type:complete len:315 (-) Transcript_20695:1006-1950(-)
MMWRMSRLKATCRIWPCSQPNRPHAKSLVARRRLTIRVNPLRTSCRPARVRSSTRAPERLRRQPPLQLPVLPPLCLWPPRRHAHHARRAHQARCPAAGQSAWPSGKRWPTPVLLAWRRGWPGGSGGLLRGRPTRGRRLKSWAGVHLEHRQRSGQTVVASARSIHRGLACGQLMQVCGAHRTARPPLRTAWPSRGAAAPPPLHQGRRPVARTIAQSMRTDSWQGMTRAGCSDGVLARWCGWPLQPDRKTLLRSSKWQRGATARRSPTPRPLGRRSSSAPTYSTQVASPNSHRHAIPASDTLPGSSIMRKRSATSG